MLDFDGGELGLESTHKRFKRLLEFFPGVARVVRAGGLYTVSVQDSAKGVADFESQLLGDFASVELFPSILCIRFPSALKVRRCVDI